MRNKILILGEAWGKDEAEAQAPFVGSAGKLLNSMLRTAGIEREECFLTNVFNLQPQPRNDVSNLCGPKEDAIPGMPYLSRGKYVSAKYKPELDRLYREIDQVKPNLILAMGATAAWATLKTSGIRQIRGAPAQSTLGYKVLPTYHPAAVLREYKLRPIVIADLFKAKRECEYPEVRRPEREIWVEPTIDDLEEFYLRYIAPSPYLSIDIETVEDQITCIGFAPDPSIALVVPFFAAGTRDVNYWKSFAEERQAWKFVRRMCALEKAIVGQNFAYDTKFLWQKYGITVPSATHDTMLLHHALQPEMEKGLGFLATIYTDEASWKFMRKSATVKKEE